MKKGLFGIALTVITASALVSCSNELNDSPISGNENLSVFKLAKNADVIAWTGSQYLTEGTITTRAVGFEGIDLSRYGKQYIKKVDKPNGETGWADEPFKYWDGNSNVEWPYEYQQYYPIQNSGRSDEFSRDAVSQEEANYIVDWVKKYPDAGSKTCGLVNYYLQNVGSSYDKYDLNEDIKNESGFSHMNGLQISNQEINDYNSVNAGARLILLNFEITNAAYKESYGSDFQENAYIFNYIEYPEGSGNINCYLCFDFKAEKNTQGSEKPVHYQGDGVHNDWIIKLIAADGNLPIPEDWVDPSKQANECHCGKEGCECTNCNCEEGEDCGCPECGEDSGSGTLPEGPNDNDNTKPGVESSKHNNEVEVNLAINDEHKNKNGEGINDLVAKLSIHVRHASDVEIFIPIGAQYYCDNDDLYILNDHDNFIHGGESGFNENEYKTQTLTYNISGNIVQLIITYEENGIRITTDGINDQVYKYCMDNFGDGINFEVMLYMNDESNLDREKFKEMLDKASIKFLGEYPEEYINAKTDSQDENGKDIDCTVGIDVEQKNNYEYQGTGPHLNGSDKNEIYTKKED